VGAVRMIDGERSNELFGFHFLVLPQFGGEA
jgi:hypothetical protein